MTFFSHRPFYDLLPFTLPSFLFLKSTFSRQKFFDNLFRILSIHFSFYLSKTFLPFSTLPSFTDDDSYFLLVTPLTPSIHTRMLFSPFYALLCALVTKNTPYAIYFFLIHHCTNSLSSLHIFVHHCTVHTKTSPGRS